MYPQVIPYSAVQKLFSKYYAELLIDAASTLSKFANVIG